MKWRRIDFRTIVDARGNLTPIEGGSEALFDIARVYYLHGVPSGAQRAGHAHKNLHQVYLALSGHFEVHLDDGDVRSTITLNRPNSGLYIGPGVWRDMENFSAGAVCLVLASAKFDEGDYIRDYEDFRRYVDRRHSVMIHA